MTRQSDKWDRQPLNKRAVETHWPEPGGATEDLAEEVTFQLNLKNEWQSSSQRCGGELIPIALKGVLRQV